MKTVEVENLTFSYGCEKPLFRDISFSVSAGEILVIAGQSGSGKTTLCQILCGIIPHAIKGNITGKIKLDGIDPTGASLPQTSLRAGMVFQDTDSQIISTTIEDELAFGLENICKQPDEIRRRVDELLAEFGFELLRYTNPASLSGGQKKLLAIAAVLAPAPPILILDEPMSGLDDEGRGLVLSVIEQQRKQGRAVVIVEHDLKTVTFADAWLLLHDGAIAVYGAPCDVLRDVESLRELGVWE